MISKLIRPAKSFARVCRYLLDKREHATVIVAEGVRSYDHRKMAEDFEMQAGTNPSLSSPVQHVILSFPPGEEIANEKLKQIAQEYLKELDLDQTQYVVVCHQDKKHKHVHIVLNRVGNSGKTIRDNFLGLRAKKKAQELTQRHGLKPAVKKNMEQAHTEQANHLDRTRYEMYNAVQVGLQKARNLQELEAWLKTQGIGVVYKYRGSSKEVQGLSFVKGDFKYKASAVDRRFSYAKLVHFFSQKQQRNKKQSLSQKVIPAQSHGGKAAELLELLLKPREEHTYTPQELLKKKKRNRSNGLGL